MILQNQEIIQLHHQLYLIGLVTLGLLIFYTILTFSRYISKKSRVALFLGLNYFLYSIAIGLFTYAHFLYKNTPDSLDEYYILTNAANAFVMLGALFLYYFFCQLQKTPKNQILIISTLSLALVIWLLTPLAKEYSILSYIFLALLNMLVYGLMTLNFFKLYLHTPQNKGEIFLLFLGSLIFLLYFVVITLYGILQISVLAIFTMILLNIAFLAYFVGFFLPYFRKNKTSDS
jgi:hypothetical protein